MATREIDIIKNQSMRLTQKQKIELIEFLSGTLEKPNRVSRQLEFGKYSSSSGRLSTEKDFELAEWHPADLHLNGN